MRWKECSHGFPTFLSFFFFFFCQHVSSASFFRPVFVDFASVKMFVGAHTRLMGTLSSQQKGLESSPHSTVIWPSVGAGCPLVVTSGTHTHTAYTP